MWRESYGDFTSVGGDVLLRALDANIINNIHISSAPGKAQMTLMLPDIRSPSLCFVTTNVSRLTELGRDHAVKTHSHRVSQHE